MTCVEIKFIIIIIIINVKNLIDYYVGNIKTKCFDYGEEPT